MKTLEATVDDSAINFNSKKKKKEKKNMLLMLLDSEWNTEELWNGQQQL